MRMSATAPPDRTEFIRLTPISAPSPWQAAVLPLSSFPTPEDQLGPVRRLIQKLVRSLGASESSVETFIELTNLHLADGAAHLSKHGRHWMPSMGLGVWPDREPPTGWTIEEFQELVPGEKVRPLMNIAMRVMGPVEARHHARDVLLGRGTIIQVLADLDGDELLEQARNLLSPPIKDPSFTSFPFYIPLLEARSISRASADQLDAWSCGTHTYIRESPEDLGILILSRSLDETLGALGGVLSSTEPREWQIPEASLVSS
jgi:hypothetical protein